MSQLATEFSQAVAAALVYAGSEDSEGEIERFLQRMRDDYDIEDQCIAGHYLRTLCLLGRYDEAQSMLPTAISPRLGGIGKDTGIIVYDIPTMSDNAVDECRRCIGHTIWARDWQKGAEVLAAVLAKYPDYLSSLFDAKGSIMSDWQAQVDVASIYEHNDGLTEALRWYVKAAANLEKSRSRIEARNHAIYSLNSSQLFGGLARVSLRLHYATLTGSYRRSPSDFGFTSEHWMSQALWFVEQNRARILLDVLTVQRTDSAALQSWINEPHEHGRYGDPIKTSGASATAQIGGSASDSSIEQPWPTALSLLQQTSGDFDLSQLLETIPPECLVLHCNTNDEGTTVFVASNQGVLAARNSPLTRRSLLQHIVAYQKDMKNVAGTGGISKDHRVAKDICSMLSQALLLPLNHFIASKEHILFVPGQELTGFPLSSLLYRGEPLFLRKRVSQAPSLAILRRLVQADSTRPRMHASILASQDESLAMATVGAAAIAKTFGTNTVFTNGLGVYGFLKHFENATLVHLATHVAQLGRGESSSNSHLRLRLAKLNRDPEIGSKNPTCLENGLAIDRAQSLPLIDLAQMHTDAAVIVFGACLCASGAVTHGNDIVGLSHAVLQSGVKSYVGALWEGSDCATLLMMVLFYHELAIGKQSTSLAECLRRAQVNFYNLTPDRADAILSEVEKSWRQANSPVTESWEKDWVSTCFCAIEQAKEQNLGIGLQASFQLGTLDYRRVRRSTSRSGVQTLHRRQ